MTLSLSRKNKTKAQRGLRRSRLEFVFLKRLERGRTGAQGVVFSHPVENVDAAIVQQGRVRDRALGRGGADFTAFEWFGGDFLDGFEAMPLGAFVFVKRHEKCSLLSYLLSLPQ